MIDILKGINPAELFSLHIGPSPEVIEGYRRLEQNYRTILNDPQIPSERIVWEKANKHYQTLVAKHNEAVPLGVEVVVFRRPRWIPLPIKAPLH